MRPFVIMNPRAGGGVSRAELRRILDRWLPGAELERTRGPGAGASLAARARADGYDTIVAAGGDGLVHEIVNGLAPNFAGIRLGLLPLGTGNDFARTLAVPRHAEKAARLLGGGRTRTMDLVRVEERSLHSPSRTSTAAPRPGVRYCVNVTVAGFGARIELDARTRRRWKGLAYLRRAAPGLIRPPPYEVAIGLGGDERIRLDALLVAIANGRFMGGGIPIAPRAEPDDGLIDVVAVRACSPPLLATLLPRILLGRHESSPQVLVRRARSVTLGSTPPAWLNVDGEVFSDRPASFEIVPDAIEWITG